MASVNFFLRGKIVDKESTIWVRLRDKDIDISVPVPYLTCKPKEWKDGKCRVSSKKMFESDTETINVRLSKLESEIISRYAVDNPEHESKIWLKEVISPSQKSNAENIYSDNVVSFIEKYIEMKRNQISEATLKIANSTKELIARYVLYKKESNKLYKGLFFKDIDNHFRTDFENYCLQDIYQVSTTYKNLKFLKMMCAIAESHDIETHRNVKTWRFEMDKVLRNTPKSVYLTFEELDKIAQTEMPNDYLDNARDWLLISCYTGQRVSDYMRFTSSMIMEDSEGQKYLEFTQIKTGAKMQIPLLNKVQEVLDKRGGEFPRKISDVKFNLYIKDVCRIAGLDEIIYNGKMMVIKREGKKSITRKVFGEYPKYELVTSHIGRKSFASNFYEIIHTTYLLNVTGHTTEKQLLAYINKTDVEKAKSTAKIFTSLGY
ncbi:phage integrase SAM-like domain-containing protein [Chryseobacterium aureum]|uniref:phage integrase SAM-like domain-containing protein n=1 Tax=Chryseobacterium aureum TaxID=2497456 RepID=UPI000F873F5C|nr:phage integrase SAM-like domain-containing protein [Chryseobacterium aureum]